MSGSENAFCFQWTGELFPLARLRQPVRLSCFGSWLVPAYRSPAVPGLHFVEHMSELATATSWSAAPHRAFP